MRGVIRNEPMAAGSHRVRLGVRDLKPGLYMLLLRAGGQEASQKIVVLM